MEPGSDSNTMVTTPATGTDATTAHPDWDLVHFDVSCARCGHDLRGLTEPKCPKCRLDFDWDEVVPLEHLTCESCGYHLFGLTETRCPECGEDFTWASAIGEYRRSRQPFFETRWRDEPFRSYLRTWWWSLWPPRLWRRLDIHDAPHVGPLIGMIVLSLTLYFVTAVTLEGCRRTLEQLMWGWGRPGWIGGIATLMMYFAAAIRTGYAPDLIAMVCLWAGASFGALMVFRQSMRLYKVRTIHVFRVWAYSMFLVLPPAVVIGYAPELAGLLARRFVPTDELTALSALALFGFVTWSLYHGYRTYLRMAHSAAVAIASQVIAMLAVLTTGMVAYHFGYRPLIILDILRGAGAW